MSGEIYTVGHSTRTLDELADMLRAFGVVHLVDVRSIPRSRHVPHFNADVLAVELPARGIAYEPFADLGGRRRTHKDSPNLGWRSAAFRGYADYMQTAAFEQALDRLISLAARRTAAIMCAEAVPWRCHRSLIADALSIRGWTVRDIMSPAKAVPHTVTPFARVQGRAITYPPKDPPPEPSLFGDA